MIAAVKSIKKKLFKESRFLNQVIASSSEPELTLATKDENNNQVLIRNQFRVRNFGSKII